MNLEKRFDVSKRKIDALEGRVRALRIDPAVILEQFVRGSGPGGQKINKPPSCVLLRYPPLDLVVRCQKDRRRSINRFLALRELVDRIEIAIAPEASTRLREAERKRASKSRRRRRARARHREKNAQDAPTRDNASSSEEAQGKN